MAIVPYKKSSLPITWRIAISIVIASIVINAISSASLIYINYKEEEKQFVYHVDEIQASHMTSLANALWHFDNKQIRVQGEGIYNLYFIGYVRISSDDNTLYERGEVSRNPENNHFMIPIQQNDRLIGELEVGFARDRILKDIIYSAQKMILMQLVAGFLLALLLFWRVHRIITRHLIDLNKQISIQKESSEHQFLTLDREIYNDELSAVVDSFNQLTEEINDELIKKETAQKALAETNNKLEQRVEERTKNLQVAIDELNDTLENLRNAQSQLIESEKLSSLGGMVAGVAHEINTPIGLCITTHSFIKDLFKDMRIRFDSGQISKNNFTEFMQNMEESVDILSKNLERAANLIQSFKHVSEDQAGEALRKFNLNDYLHEINSTLNPKLKTTLHKVKITCPEDIELEGFPGALSQVITNLVMNSLLHGFEDIKQGKITIKAEQQKNTIVIVYSDDGKGLSSESQAKIFEPFYTTKRGYGGTGLGMHLVYNLVSQTMQGTIQLQEADKGCTFLITIPAKVKEIEAPNES